MFVRIAISGERVRTRRIEAGGLNDTLIALRVKGVALVTKC